MSVSGHEVFRTWGLFSFHFSYSLKGARPDHFFDHPIATYLNFFEVLVPIDGSYFSHAHPEIWCSKIGHLRRNNQKHVKQNSKVR